MTKKKFTHRVKKRRNTKRRSHSPRILRQSPARDVERKRERGGGDSPGSSWSSVKIDNTTYTWGTGSAPPSASRREIKSKPERIEKTPKLEVERARDQVEKKHKSEIEKRREIERKTIALFKKWATAPSPVSGAVEIEEKTRNEVRKGREKVFKKPTTVAKKKSKTTAQMPKHKVKVRRKTAEKSPTHKVDVAQEIVGERIPTAVVMEKMPLIVEEESKREVKMGLGTNEAPEVHVEHKISEKKPKRETKRERAITEEEIMPEVSGENVIPTAAEEKIPPLIVEEKAGSEVKIGRGIPEDLKIMPTGISSLDGPIGGGFPSGSLVLLVGEIGSGYNEFAMTSSVMLAATKAGKLTIPPGENIVLPEEIWWVTFTRKQSDLMSEMAPSFDGDLYDLFNKQSNFKDLSEAYFATSSVPLEWVSKRPVEEENNGEMLATVGKMLAGVYNLAERPTSKPKGLLNSLADFLTKKGPNNVVILNTLTDLAMLYSESETDWYEFMIFLRGLQRATKEWGGIIYASLDANLLEKHMEQEIAACVDGVLNFEWVQAGPSERRRTLYIKKFRRLPSSAMGASMRFNVNLTSNVGLQVTKTELIEGLKS
jgi:archaellum biogenesis ATPase FlaH